MANIHRIGDLPNNNNQQPQNQGQQQQQFMNLFSGSQPISSDPKNESFLDMLRLTLCPNFTFKSATFALIAIDTVFYIAALFLGPMGEEFLSPSVESLITEGVLAKKFIIQNEFWRFLAAPFINSDITSFITNQFFLLLWAGSLEPYMSTVGVFLSYFLSGVEGGLILCYFSKPNELIISSFFAFQGLIGLLISSVVLNWNAPQIAVIKIQIILLMVIMLFFFVLSGSLKIIIAASSSVAMGVFIGLWTVKSMQDTDYERKCKIIGQVSTAFLLFLSVFIYMQVSE